MKCNCNRRKKKNRPKLSDSDKVAILISKALLRKGLSTKHRQVLNSMKMSFLLNHSLTFAQRRYAAAIAGSYEAITGR